MWILLFHGHFSNDTENENKSNPNINFKLMYMKQSMKSKGFERRLLLIMWGLFLSLSAFAQQISIKGHVVDATGEPVIGASVVEGRTTNGTITDVDGNFSLSVPANSTLTISFVGYKTADCSGEREKLVESNLAGRYGSIGRGCCSRLRNDEKERFDWCRIFCRSEGHQRLSGS